MTETPARIHISRRLRIIAILFNSATAGLVFTAILTGFVVVRSLWVAGFAAELQSHSSVVFGLTLALLWFISGAISVVPSLICDTILMRWQVFTFRAFVSVGAAAYTVFWCALTAAIVTWRDKLPDAPVVFFAFLIIAIPFSLMGITGSLSACYYLRRASAFQPYRPELAF